MEYNRRDEWIKMGFPCVRMPLSGALGGDLHGDLELTVGTIKLKGQCKCKKDGYKTIYKELEDHDFTEVKADNKPTIVSFKKETLAEIIRELQLMACAAA